MEVMSRGCVSAYTGYIHWRYYSPIDPMPRPLITYLLGMTTVLSLWGIWKVVEKSKRIVPPWHPFELRSDLTLDDLVADGYRVSDMPCGMVHFSKTIGDTTIRYWVNIDCEDYRGKHNPQLAFDMFLEEEVIPSAEEITPSVDETTGSGKVLDPKTEQPANKDTRSPWHEEVALDPYWPFDRNAARKCYQHISWRHYWFTMETIDSMAVKYFANRYGSFTYDEQWNCSDGGSFKVGNPLNNLSFQCMIHKVDQYDTTNSGWQLTMINDIPFLDQYRYEKHLEWERKRIRYNREE